MPANLINQTLLDQFRVESFIASGGMGAVYRVRDLKRNVPLAMKVLHGEFAEDPHILKHFKREANALKKLAHPNIVQFFGLYETADLTFLLERYIDGPTLKDILKARAGKPFSIQEVFVYLKALTSALGYAHANGVVHCDVKPGNILIDAGGNLYLTDFGVARHADSTTTTIAAAGTAAYMAPEQVRGDSVTPATDIYALGVMLFEMLTGQRPFRGDEPGLETHGDTGNERIRYAHLNVQPPDPRTIHASISLDVAQTIVKAMSKDPHQRFRSMQEFMDVLYAASGVASEQVTDRVMLPVEPQDSKTETTSVAEATKTTTYIPRIPKPGVPLMIGGATLALIVIVILATFNKSGSPQATEEPELISPFVTRTDADIPTKIPVIPPTVTPIPASSYQQGKVAYVQRDAAKVYFLYQMDLAKGGDPEMLLEPVKPSESRYYAPWFAPDGQALAYDDFYLGKTFVMDPASPTNGHSLGSCASPSFSPDGTHLICYNSKFDYFPIYDVSSGEMVDRIQHGKSGAVLPAWSPDGSEIAFSILEGNGRASIWKMDVSGGSPVAIATDADEDYAPAWSPDGEWITFQSTLTSERSEVWIMRPDGSDRKQITTSGGGKFWSRGPCFSPDGQWLAFVSNQSEESAPDFGDVFVISLRTGEQQQITFSGGFVLDWRVTWGVGTSNPNGGETTDTSDSSRAVTSPIDGATLVRIPAGDFTYGLSEAQVDELLAMCPACKRSYVTDELPQRQIYLDEFWMDQAEVTNAQFAQFIAETDYVTSAEQRTYETSYVFDLNISDFNFNGNADWKHPHGSASNISNLDQTAVTQISWEDAEAYCKWAGRRLPTEAEWEKAARGTDGRIFVWGNEPPSSQFLNFNLTSNGPQTVGSFADGVSEYGLYDMAGNVWEWVSDFYGESYYQKAPERNPSGPTTGEGYVLRGGSWASEYKDMYLVTTTARLWNYSYVSSDVLGFRCATSTP